MLGHRFEHIAVTAPRAAAPIQRLGEDDENDGLGKTTDDTLKSVGHMFAREDAAARKQNQPAAPPTTGLGATADEDLSGVHDLIGMAEFPGQVKTLTSRLKQIRDAADKPLVSVAGAARDRIAPKFEIPSVARTSIEAGCKKSMPPLDVIESFSTKLTSATKPGDLEPITAFCTKAEAARTNVVKWAVDELASFNSGAVQSAYPSTGLAADKLDKQLTTDVNTRVRVAERRRDYKSSHDKDEKHAFGASYALSDTPYAVHIHAGGSGTRIDAVSVKDRNDEYGSPVISNRNMSAKLKAALQDGVVRAPEPPRVISEQRKTSRETGTWRQGSTP